MPPRQTEFSSQGYRVSFKTERSSMYEATLHCIGNVNFMVPFSEHSGKQSTI